MAPPAKSNDARRKSEGSGLVVTLNVDPSKLREIVSDSASPPEDVDDVKQSPSSPSTQPAAAATANGENASDSNAATPQAEGTPTTPGAMPPPAEGSKKKGVKRSAAAANGGADGAPKQRGKPGPKKKPRLEDGTIDHANTKGGGGPHKLGPKANLGAINAGLRALDRSGKPCRKWARGGFRLKTFTGVVWEIPRWTAPPKPDADAAAATADESTVPSAEESSGKENKDAAAAETSAVNSNSGADAEMQSAASAHASSPAPMAVTAAS